MAMDKANSKKKQLLWMMISLMLASALSSMDQDILSTAMPTIVKDLGSSALYGWVFTAYMVSSTISLIVFSRWSDIYGTRSIFVLGLVIFLIGSILGAIAHSMIALVIYRFIQGIGGGVLIILPMIMIAQLFPKEEWGKWQGLLFAAFGIGNLLGPVLGGVLTQFMGWRWVFLINVPITILAILIFLMYGRSFRQEIKQEYNQDTAGLVLFILSLGLFLIGIDQFKTLDQSWLSVALLISGISSGFFFFRRQEKVLNPLIPLSVFSRDVIVLFSISFLISFSMIGTAAYVPLYLQDIKGLSPAISGFIMLPIILVTILSSVIIGALLSRVRPKGLLVGVLVMLFIPLGLISTVQPNTNILNVIIYGCLLGVGIGGSLPITMVMVQVKVKPEHLSLVTSLQTFVRTLGATVGLVVAGALIASNTTGYLMEQLRLIFIINTFTAFVSFFIVIFLIPSNKLQTVKHTSSL